MDVTRQPRATHRGPAEGCTGVVWMDEVAANEAPSRVHAVVVHFAPRARTGWHRHPLGQVIHVIEGEGRAQAADGPVEVLRAGDTVHFRPCERHWHGAAPHRSMSHVAIHEADDQGVTITFEDLVSDQEYTAGDPGSPPAG